MFRRKFDVNQINFLEMNCVFLPSYQILQNNILLDSIQHFMFLLRVVVEVKEKTVVDLRHQQSQN